MKVVFVYSASLYKALVRNHCGTRNVRYLCI